MQPIEFKHQNTVIAKDQPQYNPLPAYIADNPQGEVNCFISVTPEELEQIKQQGGFFFNMWCFGNAITPIRFQTECPIIDWQPIDDLSPENLFKICMNGTAFSNMTMGKDAIKLQVESIKNDVVTVNNLNTHKLEIYKQEVFDFKSFSEYFKQFVTLHGKPYEWFFANNFKQL